MLRQCPSLRSSAIAISELNFKERSLLFTKLARIAYFDEKKARSEVKKLGFTTTEFYQASGAQAYRFMNKDDLIIACRGTQPSEWNDIKADLRALPVLAETVSRVHKGFKREVDELWPGRPSEVIFSLNFSTASSIPGLLPTIYK